jgi:hypothetical protein
MKVRKEIELYAAPSDVEVLLWLFDRYHWEPQWMFVACCRFERTGAAYWQSCRVWTPTMEGRAIYRQFS